jgi:hypothetical protein
MAEHQWIWVSRWEDFQHYQHSDGKVPAWTKSYTQLVNDEAYLNLSSHLRAVLHGVWLSFASARCHLGAETSSLSSRLRLRVMTRDIYSLCDAGFIQVCSREALDELYSAYRATLASRAPARSPELDKEVEEEPSQKVSSSSTRSDEREAAAPSPNGRAALDTPEDLDLEPAKTPPRFDCPECAQIFPTWSERNTHLALDHRREETHA